MFQQTILNVLKKSQALKVQKGWPLYLPGWGVIDLQNDGGGLIIWFIKIKMFDNKHRFETISSKEGSINAGPLNAGPY